MDDFIVEYLLPNCITDILSPEILEFLKNDNHKHTNINLSDEDVSLSATIYSLKNPHQKTLIICDNNSELSRIRDSILRIFPEKGEFTHCLKINNKKEIKYFNNSSITLLTYKNLECNIKGRTVNNVISTITNEEKMNYIVKILSPHFTHIKNILFKGYTS